MRKFLVAATLLTATLAPATVLADAKSSIQAWTPLDQGESNERRSDLGMSANSGMLLLADELGDKLNELGRANFIIACFGRLEAAAGTKALMEWALCGHDVKVFDRKKLAKELADNKAPPALVEQIDQALAEPYAVAQKIGATIEAEAKTDPGIKLVLAQADAARAEWKTYIGTHKADFDRYLALKDAVRGGKTNHPAFQGCFEALQPAWQKYVTATSKKIPWDVGNDVMQAYMNFMKASIEGHILAVSWAACEWSLHPSGESAFAAAAVTRDASTLKAGPRTVALGKLLDENLKPAFADRSLRLDRTEWKYGVQVEGINENTAIATPQDGVVGKLVPAGDMTKVVFKKDKVEVCLQWADTNRISSFSAAGNFNYEKKCLRRGMVANDIGTIEVLTKNAAGIKAGDRLIIVNQFPVVAWKGKKLTALLGVALK